MASTHPFGNDPAKTERYKAFWNLSHKTTMLGNASDLCAFRLMPVEDHLRKPIEAEWSFTIIDMDRRIVAFKDESYGTITTRTWDFGDGTTSHEQNPIHVYDSIGAYSVSLTVGNLTSSTMTKTNYINVHEIDIEEENGEGGGGGEIGGGGGEEPK